MPAFLDHPFKDQEEKFAIDIAIAGVGRGLSRSSFFCFDLGRWRADGAVRKDLVQSIEGCDSISFRKSRVVEDHRDQVLSVSTLEHERHSNVYKVTCVFAKNVNAENSVRFLIN